MRSVKPFWERNLIGTAFGKRLHQALLQNLFFLLKGHMTLLDFLGLLWPRADAEGLRTCLRWCRFYHAREVLAQLLKEKRASMRESRLYRGSIVEEAQSGRRPVARLDHLDQADLKVRA